MNGPPLPEHRVLAPNAQLRALVVPQGQAQAETATKAAVATACEAETVQGRPHRISWVRLLKCVFDIDKQQCPNCGAGEIKIIAAMLGVSPDAKGPGSRLRLADA